MTTKTSIRRFYKQASHEKQGRIWQVMLDDKALRTPARQVLRLPTEKLAILLAREWQDQEDSIKPDQMPLTKLANVAQDHVAPDRVPSAGELMRFAANDVICFRVEQPKRLQELQASKCDPWLDWAEKKFDARLGVTAELRPPDMPLAALENMRNAALKQDPFTLTALLHAVSILGSAVLGFAMVQGKMDAKTAFDLSRIEEDWQIKQWGDDDEALLRSRNMLVALQSSYQFMQAAKC
jgi:chaperone required for assembly of F1-ATPase